MRMLLFESNMAASSSSSSRCVLTRVLARLQGAGLNNQVVCGESLLVLSVDRYIRDNGSALYFPHTVHRGDDLYDVTVTDGDCRLRVTIDPSLNRLVERNVLSCGTSAVNAAFCRAVSGYLLVTTEIADRDTHLTQTDTHSLPWCTHTQPGPLMPLTANRSSYLPLWNNVDYSGDSWRHDAPPGGEEETRQGGNDKREKATSNDHRTCVFMLHGAVSPGVTVAELQRSFVGQRDVARGTVQRHMIVRIINKSHLVHYGKAEQNCECPYKGVLEVCDHTARVCVVLWNSVCTQWFSALRPGMMLRLSHYRVKPCYMQPEQSIEISLNSRNPTARIKILPESSVSPNYLPPQPDYTFYNCSQLLSCPDGNQCDVIGLLTFVGRAERIRGKGSDMLEYRWLRLEDGTSDQPITVKLFATSQPEIHRKLRPLSVVVCTRLKVVRSSPGGPGCFYLTNNENTQVYITGQHSEMPYRKLRPIKPFLQWMKGLDERQVMSRALIGGFFAYPPAPVSLETHIKEGAPELLGGAELQRRVESLRYRERDRFCIQATVTMVTHCHRGQEDQCLVWTDRQASHLPSLGSPTPSANQMSPRPQRARTSFTSPKRKLLTRTETPRKRLPLATLQRDQHSDRGVLWDASMEFLEVSAHHDGDEDDEDDGDEDEDEDDDAWSFVTAAAPPLIRPVAMETLPLRYSHAQGEELAAATALQPGEWAGLRHHHALLERFDPAVTSWYTLTLKVLSDSVVIETVFLPHLPPLHLLPHNNTWLSILSHGAFSPHTPPPSPADLIGMATQLANQRLVCVLDACHLGGARTEIVLTRAYSL